MTEIYSEGLGRLGDLGGYIELYGYWTPGHSPDDAAQILMGVAGYLANVQVPLQGAKQIAERDTARRFEEENEPDGTSWEPLSDRYWHQKVELEGFPDEILTREHLLRDVAPSGWHVIGTELIYDPSVLPKNTKGFSYGKVMQDGNPARNVKARPFIGLSNEALIEIAAEFEHWFEMLHYGRVRSQLGSNVLGEAEVIGGFFRAGGYQPRLSSGQFGRMR